MRLLEFCITNKVNSYDNISVKLVDGNDISSIEQTKNENFCKIIEKNGYHYFAVGKYRTLTNRLIYALSKNKNFFHDNIMRPTGYIYHQIESLQIDQAHHDAHQMAAFLTCTLSYEKEAILSLLNKIDDEFCAQKISELIPLFFKKNDSLIF